MFLNVTEETCTGTGDTLALTGATADFNAFGKTGNGEEGALYSCVVKDSGGVIRVAGIYTFNKAANTMTRNDTWNDNGATVDKNPATNIALGAGTHTITCDAVTRSVTAYSPLVADRDYFSGAAAMGNNTSKALTEDVIYLMPFLVEIGGVYDAFRVRVGATGTATKARMILMDIVSFRLISESADIDMTTATEKVASFTGVNLEKGYYYVCIIADGTVTLDTQDDLAGSGFHFLGSKNIFATRGCSHTTEAVAAGWTSFPVVTSEGARQEDDAPCIALRAL